MTAADLFKKEQIYSGEAEINGIGTSIGYMKEFRLSWMATQLNTFICVGKTEAPITRSVIESYSSQCFQYALRNNKGWPRGFQAGIASIAILQGATMEEDAQAFCAKLSKRHWSAFEIPVLYNTVQNKAIRYTNAPMWGAVYFPFFSKTIDSITSQF